MPIPNDYRRKGTMQLRIGRYSKQNLIYHVSASTHRRLPIFTSLANGRLLTRAMMRIQEDGHADTLAFVIMPDHLHWLLQLSGSRSLSSCVSAVKSESSRAINKAGGLTSRKIWQSGFHDRAIRKDDDLVGVSRYIIANPVRAGLVESVGAYALWDAVWF